MALKYSVVLATLASSPGGQVWEDPDTVLGAVADAGYDGVDLDAEPDRIDEALRHHGDIGMAMRITRERCAAYADIAQRIPARITFVEGWMRRAVSAVIEAMERGDV
jgi:hypothetical protein